MLPILAVRLVDFCRRHAVAVVLLALGLTVMPGNYAGRHLGMSTETASLMSADLPYLLDGGTFLGPCALDPQGVRLAA